MSWINSRVNRKEAAKHLKEGGRICVQFHISLKRPFGVVTPVPYDSTTYSYECSMIKDKVYFDADRALRDTVLALTKGDFEEIEEIELHAC